MVGAVASISGNLLMPGDHIPKPNCVSRETERRGQMGDKRMPCCVLGRKGLALGLGERGWEVSGPTEVH